MCLCVWGGGDIVTLFWIGLKCHETLRIWVDFHTSIDIPKKHVPYVSNPTTITVRRRPIFMITMYWEMILSLYIIRILIACNTLHCSFTSSNEDFTWTFYILFPFADMYCSTTMIHFKQPFDLRKKEREVLLRIAACNNQIALNCWTRKLNHWWYFISF